MSFASVLNATKNAARPFDRETVTVLTLYNWILSNLINQRIWLEGRSGNSKLIGTLEPLWLFSLERLLYCLFHNVLVIPRLLIHNHPLLFGNRYDLILDKGNKKLGGSDVGVTCNSVRVYSPADAAILMKDYYGLITKLMMHRSQLFN